MYLVIGRSSIYTIAHQNGVLSTDKGAGTIAEYTYVQIESVQLLSEADRRTKIDDNHFGIQINFYDKDLDLAKRNILYFECFEPADLDEQTNTEDQEEIKRDREASGDE